LLRVELLHGRFVLRQWVRLRSGMLRQWLLLRWRNLHVRSVRLPMLRLVDTRWL
jgi:hypothetical protein